MAKPTFEQVHKRIMALKPKIISVVKAAIIAEIKKTKRLSGYKVVWNQLQEISTPRMRAVLQKEFPKAKFIETSSKSTYPDLKMTLDNLCFAFDIKSNETQKEPWYDIARLDTVVEERLDKYNEEYDLVVRYDSVTGRLVDVYFEVMRETVGFDARCKGVKFRPYDGKLRPKSWKYFEKGAVHWKTKNEFKQAIRLSQIHRWRILIQDILVPLLTPLEKLEFKRFFD